MRICARVRGRDINPNNQGIETLMSQRTRKLIGTVLLIVMITIYSLLALGVAGILEVRGVNAFVEFLYYVIAGLLWVLPAGIIIKWMSKPDRA